MVAQDASDFGVRARALQKGTRQGGWDTSLQDELGVVLWSTIWRPRLLKLHLHCQGFPLLTATVAAPGPSCLLASRHLPAHPSSAPKPSCPPAPMAGCTPVLAALPPFDLPSVSVHHAGHGLLPLSGAPFLPPACRHTPCWAWPAPGWTGWSTWSCCCRWAPGRVATECWAGSRWVAGQTGVGGGAGAEGHAGWGFRAFGAATAAACWP